MDQLARDHRKGCDEALNRYAAEFFLSAETGQTDCGRTMDQRLEYAGLENRPQRPRLPILCSLLALNQGVHDQITILRARRWS